MRWCAVRQELSAIRESNETMANQGSGTAISPKKPARTRNRGEDSMPVPRLRLVGSKVLQIGSALSLASAGCCCWPCTCDLEGVSVNGVALDYFPDSLATPSGPMGGPFFCDEVPPGPPTWHATTDPGPLQPFYSYWWACEVIDDVLTYTALSENHSLSGGEIEELFEEFV